MTNQEKTQAVLEAVRNTEGLERLLIDPIKHMVDNFLGWRLPEDFYPDAGISFKKEYNGSQETMKALGLTEPSRHEPVGTNLFTAEQAKEMFRFVIEDDFGNPIIGNHVQWSDVLVAMGGSYGIDGVGCIYSAFSKCKDGNYPPIIKIDLTRTPEQNLLADPNLTDFLYELLVKK